MQPNKLTAAINDSVRPLSINMARIYQSIERRYAVVINASWTGIEVESRNGLITVYKDGTYTAAQAKGREQCTAYRMRMMAFLLWAQKQMPTTELEKIAGWINEQVH